MFANRMHVRLVHSIALASAAAGLAHAGSPLPSSDSEERAVSEGLEFAEGLAADWQFVDMAIEVLDGVAAGDLDSDQKRLVDLTRAKVFGSAAKNEREDERKEQLFTDALERCGSFLDRHADSNEGEQAKRFYVDLASEYGQFMAERLEDVGGEEAQRIREELDDRLNKVSFFATETIAELQDQLSDLTQIERNELFKLQLAQGNLLLILGRVSDGGGESYFSNAAETMEELIYSAGPDTGFGLNAYHVLGRVEAARGHPADAADYYEYVATQVVPDDDEVWGTMRAENPETMISTLWAYYEREISWLVEAHQEAGDGEKAVSRALRFLQPLPTGRIRPVSLRSPVHARRCPGAARSRRLRGRLCGGRRTDLVPLARGPRGSPASASATARAPPSSPWRWRRASTRRTAATRCRSAPQRLISQVVDSGLDVTPAILFEAALGSYNSGNYPQAITGLRQLISRLDNDTDRKLFMPRIQY